MEFIFVSGEILGYVYTHL